MTELLMERGVLIDTGTTFFGRENAPKNFFRISYSSISTEKIEDGIAKIAHTVSELT